MYDDVYGVQDIRWSTSVDLSKGIVVCSLLSFYFLFLSFLWPQWLFLFISHLSNLGSFRLSSLGSFGLSSLGSFPHFRGNTLYITRSIEDLSHFKKLLSIKNMKVS